MEKGLIKTDDEFYDQYIHFYHQSFKSKPNFENWNEDYLTRLYHAFEYYDANDFDHLWNELNNEFHEYQYCIYYQENIEMISYIFRYYKDNDFMNEDEINDSLDLVDLNIFDKRIVILLLEIMYVSSINKIGDIKLIDNVFKRINNYNNEELLQYVISINEKHNSNLINSLSIVQKKLFLLERKTK